MLRLSRQFVSVLGLVDRKISFLELCAGEDNARFARQAHHHDELCSRSMLISSFTSWSLATTLQPVPTLTQSLAEALASPCCILRECEECGYEVEKLIGRLTRYVH